MTDQHYTHTCQVCKTEFHATLNKDGSIRKRKYLACSQACYKVAAGLSSGIKRPEHKMKDCAFCGKEFGPMPPGKAKQKTYCSRICAQSVNRRTDEAECELCGKPFKQNRFNKRFCGYSCSNNRRKYKPDTAIEIEAIKRIAKARKKKIRRIASLHRMIESSRQVVCNCSVCGSEFNRRIGFLRYCSDECRATGYKAVRKRKMHTEKGRATRRRAKAKRRAIERGANGAESIDPIAVFERDKWRCHICGVKTDRRLRGTSAALAPELDHIVTIAEGGSHTYGNVACSCRSCNHAKGSGSLGQIGFGFV